MGFLDRFKKNDGPSADALTKEAMLRMRTVPGVTGVTIVDGETLSVTWDSAGTHDLDISRLREMCAGASGFERIDHMDNFFESVTAPMSDATDAGGDVALPPIAGIDDAPPPSAVVPEPVAAPTPEPAPPGAPPTDLSVRVAKAPAGGVSFPLVDGIDAVVTRAGVDVGLIDCGEWGVEPEDVQAAALAALAATDLSLDAIDDGAWIPSSAVPAAAWLAAPDRLLAAAGLSSAVILTPLPTELVLVDAANADLLAGILRSTAAILAEQADILCSAPLHFDGTTLEAWKVPADHPAAELVDELRSFG